MQSIVVAEDMPCNDLRNRQQISEYKKEAQKCTLWYYDRPRHEVALAKSLADVNVIHELFFL
jgi:hypothetical protein